jgi:hypothetical protein
MAKLTIERLGDKQPGLGAPMSNALVLCVDGQVVEGQVSTSYTCEGPDSLPVFRVTFACWSDTELGDGPILELCPINVNSFDVDNGTQH